MVSDILRDQEIFFHIRRRLLGTLQLWGLYPSFCHVGFVLQFICTWPVVVSVLQFVVYSVHVFTRLPSCSKLI